MTKHEEGEEELSEAQRLAMLEDTVSTNRVVLMIMAVLAVIAISVAVTIAVVKVMQPDVTYVDSKSFAKLERDVEILKEAAIAHEQNLLDTRTILDSSNATAFKALMLEQEKSYQLHLNALKQGMRDLARMVPGSRTWLDIYDEQMNEALAESRARMNRLSKLQTSELPAVEAVPLPDRGQPVPVIN
ncbi:MAG: hypothetical protein LRY66_16530 [Saccharospirillaceae bacterium]|nr:hypothetical protein [Saccharospirillaceae bacterium]MCD8532912.1 hypothetical protein [Saccharospirillaceae bacterium]